MTESIEMDKLCNLDNMPTDVLLMILKNLNYKDLVKMSEVNKHFYQVANDNLLWKLKLESDINKWKIISSNNFPIEMCNNYNNGVLDNNISYKTLYLNCCPDVLVQIEILRKLKMYKNALLDNTNETSGANSGSLAGENNTNNNNTMMAIANKIQEISGVQVTTAMSNAVNMVTQMKDFIYRNILNDTNVHTINGVPNSNLNDGIDNDSLQKIVMFGPGLETTTSCLVTNLLWKSEFKTIGMIPGRDGYGSGLKLKLFNHSPFNLTVLYTNVSKLRQNRDYKFDKNKLFVKRKANNQDASSGSDDNEDQMETSNNNDGDEIDTEDYEICSQVKDACANAAGFIYVIDNNSLSETVNTANYNEIVNNYKTELFTLMKECNKKHLPLLILACSTEIQYGNGQNNANNSINNKLGNSNMPCVDIIKLFSLYKLKHEWQIRNCKIFQNKMKDIVLGFDWLLNRLDEGRNFKC